MRSAADPLLKLAWRYGPAALAVPGLLFTPFENGWLWIGLLAVSGIAQAIRIDYPVGAWALACATAVALTVLRPEMYLVTEFIPLLPFAQIAIAGDLRRTVGYLAASVALAFALTLPSAGLPLLNLTLVVSVFALPLPVYGAAAAWAHGYGTRRLYVEMLLERADTLERDQARQAELAVLAERGRIARDLHDVITHGVAVMVVQADAADAIWDVDAGRGRQAVRDVAETGRSVMGELRAMLDAMRGLDDDATAGAERTATAGLEGAAALVGRLEGAGIATTLTVEGDVDAVPSPVSLAAERILRESLTNVLRHARATRADVLVRVTGDAVHLHVADDGVGLDGSPEGHGLPGMRERAALAGGAVRVATRPQGGTAVEADLPLEAP